MQHTPLTTRAPGGLAAGEVQAGAKGKRRPRGPDGSSKVPAAREGVSEPIVELVPANEPIAEAASPEPIPVGQVVPKTPARKKRTAKTTTAKAGKGEKRKTKSAKG